VTDRETDARATGAATARIFDSVEAIKETRKRLVRNARLRIFELDTELTVLAETRHSTNPAIIRIAERSLENIRE
jgi:hypothetical protein